ncbi:MAG: glucose 1-dehydrogenase [Dehalococcoidia bacterium]|nr:glucose 1-dehydrogenase [Dehalococcoidia bacterium]MDZ4247003.1 glucose 1-dehydrogenase [Dehalococcoidia bacterium]
MSVSVKDKVVIVTGAGRGIGRAYAEELAGEGAKVVVAEIVENAGKDTVQAITGKGGEAFFIRTDVTDFETCKKMAEDAVSKYGAIDALINNAALYGIDTRSLFQIPDEEWDRMMNINVKGIWHCIKAVLPQMTKQGKGKIINVSSGVALRGVPFLLHYVASKGAVYSMTKALAMELPLITKANITVNSICPGLTFTQASIDMMVGHEKAIDVNIADQCLKRKEMPDDLVGAVHFLVSDASDFMTGASIVVDGGAARY